MERQSHLEIVYADNSIDAQYMKVMENGLNEQAKVKKGLDVIKSFSFACFDNDNGRIRLKRSRRPRGEKNVEAVDLVRDTLARFGSLIPFFIADFAFINT